MKEKISAFSRTVLVILVLALVTVLLPACGPKTVRVENPQDGGEIEAFCAAKSKEVFGKLNGAYTLDGDFGFITGNTSEGILFCKMSRGSALSTEVLLPPNTAFAYVEPNNYPKYTQLKGAGAVETAIEDLQKNWEKWVLGAVGVVSFIVVGNKVVGVVRGLRGGASVADDAARVVVEEYGDDALRVLVGTVGNMGDEGLAALRATLPQADDVGHLALLAGYENADELARVLGVENADELARLFSESPDDIAKILGAENADEVAKLTEEVSRIGRNQLSAVRVGFRSGETIRFAAAQEKGLAWQGFPVYQSGFTHINIKVFGLRFTRDTGMASMYYMAYPNFLLKQAVLAEGDDAVRGVFSLGEGMWTTADGLGDMTNYGARVFRPGAPMLANSGDDAIRSAPELGIIGLPGVGRSIPVGGQVVREAAAGAESLNLLKMMDGAVPGLGKEGMFLVPVAN